MGHQKRKQSVMSASLDWAVHIRYNYVAYRSASRQTDRGGYRDPPYLAEGANKGRSGAAMVRLHAQPVLALLAGDRRKLPMPGHPCSAQSACTACQRQREQTLLCCCCNLHLLTGCCACCCGCWFEGLTLAAEAGCGSSSCMAWRRAVLRTSCDATASQRAQAQDAEGSRSGCSVPMVSARLL